MVPGDDKKAQSRCAQAVEIGGSTMGSAVT
jgi:hypothetical protein